MADPNAGIAKQITHIGLAGRSVRRCGLTAELGEVGPAFSDVPPPR